jgi:hypothetical protein
MRRRPLRSSVATELQLAPEGFMPFSITSTLNLNVFCLGNNAICIPLASAVASFIISHDCGLRRAQRGRTIDKLSPCMTFSLNA